MFIDKWMDKDVIYIYNGILLLFSHAVVSWLSVTTRTAAHQTSLSLEICQICVNVHCTGDPIQPFHPLMPSSLSVLHLSQHQGLFQWVVCSIRWPKYWSFSFSISPSNECSGLISLKIDWLISSLSQGLSGVFSNTTVQRHQFFGALTSLWSSSHKCTWPLARP